MAWKYTRRKVRGRVRRVKVSSGGLVRLVGVRNHVDRSARRMGRVRKRGYYNTTDRSGRRMRSI